MSHIVLSKDGDITRYSNTDESKEVVEPHHVLYNLGETVQLEDGFKIKHLFEVIKNYIELAKINPVIMFFLEDFQELSKTAKQSELDTIFIQRMLIKYPKSDTKYRVDVAGKEGDEIYSCSFIGLEQLREAEIKINDGIIYTYPSGKGDVIEEKFETWYNLFELVNEIFDEFGFYGTKESRNAEKQKLDDICKDLGLDLPEGHPDKPTTEELLASGKLVSGDEVFKRLEELDLPTDIDLDQKLDPKDE